jgi:hypothetical protein
LTTSDGLSPAFDFCPRGHSATAPTESSNIAAAAILQSGLWRANHGKTAGDAAPARRPSKAARNADPTLSGALIADSSTASSRSPAVIRRSRSSRAAHCAQDSVCARARADAGAFIRRSHPRSIIVRSNS